MAGTQMLWACFLVAVTAVRSQDSYGSPPTLTLNPAFSPGVTSGSRFSRALTQDNFNPSNFQRILGSGRPTNPANSKNIQNDNVVPPLPLFNDPASKTDFTGVSNRKRSEKSFPVPGGIDFSKASRTEDGRLCIIKEESIETLSKDPILECTHKDVEQCHYTYITYFKPSQERSCEENFEKVCQITFSQRAVRETVRKCYKPLEKICDSKAQPQYNQPQTGYGEPQQGYGSPEDNQECRTVFETSCTTRYIEKSPGKILADTKCEKLPFEICGKGCTTKEGPEECHNKEIDTLVDIPEETCDLNPQKTCRMTTRLVPSLKPKKECTIVPKETCNLKFTQPQIEKKPLRTEWCLEEESKETESTYDAPGQSYNAPEQSYNAPDPAYNAPEQSYNAPEQSYDAPEQSYNAPEQSYDAPEQSYNAREQSYDAPDKSYDGPEVTYDAPEPNSFYGKPEQTYDAPVQTYDTPKQTIDDPEQTYDAPVKTYNAPKQTYDAPEQTYDAPEQQYNAPDQSYDAPARTYDAPKQPYNAPIQSYDASKYDPTDSTYDAPLPTYSLSSFQPTNQFENTFATPEDSYDAPKQIYISPSQQSYAVPQIQPKLSFVASVPTYFSSERPFSPSQPIYRSNTKTGRRSK